MKMSEVIVITTMVVYIMLMVVPAACDVTFNIHKDTYSTFVEKVRSEVKDPKLKYHGLPTVKLWSSKDPKFFFVELTAESNGKPTITTTLQVKKADLYVVGYKDVLNKNDRAFYISPDKNDKTYEAKEIFPNVKNRLPMPFKVDYGSIQSAAQLDIDSLTFTIDTLENFMRAVHGKAANKKLQARFVLLAIQMTAEAARFKYVEQKTTKGQKSDYKVISLEKNWDKLSTAISCNPSDEDKFPETIVLNVNKGWKVDKVSEIKPYMGLLKYVDVKKDCKKKQGFANSFEMNNKAYVYEQ